MRAGKLYRLVARCVFGEKRHRRLATSTCRELLCTTSALPMEPKMSSSQSKHSDPRPRHRTLDRERKSKIAGVKSASPPPSRRFILYNYVLVVIININKFNFSPLVSSHTVTKLSTFFVFLIFLIIITTTTSLCPAPSLVRAVRVLMLTEAAPSCGLVDLVGEPRQVCAPASGMKRPRPAAGGTLVGDGVRQNGYFARLGNECY